MAPRSEVDQTSPKAALRPLSRGVALAFCAAAPFVWGNPSGGQAVHGGASMQTTAGGKNLKVATTNGAGTNHSVIHWQSFSIPQGNATHFAQPNAQSTSINRVVTNNPSAIFGSLSSNGKLVVVNPSGITVGAGAVVDTAGFTASALNQSAEDAAAGRMRFNSDGITAAGAGSVNVNGQVLARSGDVVLLGKNVEVGAAGVVRAPDGAVVLAAGQKAEIVARGLEGVRLEVGSNKETAVNLGTLQGNAVGIFAGSLRHSGLIQATGATVEGGRVVLQAQDVAEVNGRIEAKQGENGGNVQIEARIATLNGEIAALGLAPGGTGGQVGAQATAVLQGGSIDVSGAQAGGVIEIRADNLIEQTRSTQLIANALAADGQAGRVSLNAQASLLTSATLEAQGVAAGARGGRVEVYAPQIQLMAARRQWRRRRRHLANRRWPRRPRPVCTQLAARVHQRLHQHERQRAAQWGGWHRHRLGRRRHRVWRNHHRARWRGLGRRRLCGGVWQGTLELSRPG
jgi:filamentous hemagglutinin family protein